MPLNDRDREALKKITPDLHKNPTLVMDLLPRLSDVLLQSDIHSIEYRADAKGGYEWAANQLLNDYTKRAKNLNPMANALRAVGMDELADKLISKLSERDLQLLRNAQDVLLSDGDAGGLIEALRGRIFDQTDEAAILNQDTDASKMMKLIEIYKSKASSLLPLIDALRSNTQPHIAHILQNQ